mgnify:CR=1 FL=1
MAREVTEGQERMVAPEVLEVLEVLEVPEVLAVPVVGAEALVAPTALAAQQTGEVLQSLRSDIDHATLAAERARNDMALLREALAQETTRLNEAAENAGRTARRLTENLGRERDQMQTLGGVLDGQASGVVEAVGIHERFWAEFATGEQPGVAEAAGERGRAPGSLTERRGRAAHPRWLIIRRSSRSGCPKRLRQPLSIPAVPRRFYAKRDAFQSPASPCPRTRVDRADRTLGWMACGGFG